MITKGGGCGGGSTKNPASLATKGGGASSVAEEEENQLLLLAFILAALRKSMVSCRVDRSGAEEAISSQIGWPTNVPFLTVSYKAESL